jgi:aryl-alcohol dehydrogenase-like predicted oxidoreductase
MAQWGLRWATVPLMTGSPLPPFDAHTSWGQLCSIPPRCMAGDRGRRFSGGPSRIRKVVDASLTNLGCDTIDLLYQHRLDPTVPIEDVVGTMSDLVAEGKVTYLGLCEATPEAIRRAHAVHPISVLQTEFSLFAQDAAALFPLLDELAIGFVAYSPLARGFLGGVARPAADYGPADFRAYMDWWKPENFRANTRIVDRLAEIAGAKDASVAQIALAWVLAQREFIVPIPGSRNTDRVLENVMAADMSLTTDELSAISATAPTGAHGDRGTPSPWLQDRT